VEVKKRVSNKIERFALAFTGCQEFFVKFLSREGMIRANA
jgi:hypothetical protein